MSGEKKYQFISSDFQIYLWNQKGFEAYRVLICIGNFYQHNILLMQFLSRRLFCTSSPYSLKTILEKEVIPARKESTSPETQNLPNLEKNMAIKSSPRSKWMMPSWAWEDFLLCSTTARSLTPSPASPSEDIRSLSFVNKLKKHLEEWSLSQKLCFSFWPQVATPIKRNFNGWQTNWKRKEI